TSVVGRADRIYTRMWFDGQDNLVGVTQKLSHLTLQRWNGGSIAQSWEMDLIATEAQADTPGWTISPDVSRLAWISGWPLYATGITTSRNEAAIEIALPAGRTPLASGAFADGSLVVVFAHASVERWDAATGGALASFHIPLSELSQAVLDGDYLAVSSDN